MVFAVVIKLAMSINWGKPFVEFWNVLSTNFGFEYFKENIKFIESS